MTVRRHVAIFGLFVLLVALYTWPLVRDPAHLFPDNHDPRLFSWVMLTVFRNLSTQPTALLHGNAFYPVGLSLTFAEPLLTPALVAGPLHALSGSPVLAYNLTLILFWALSGWAMYAVAYWVGRDHAAAFVGAVVFTFCAYRTELYLEFQMQVLFGIPLTVYALVRFLEAQRTRYLAGLLAVFWAQAVAVWYYAVILGFGLVVVAVQYVALRWRGWQVRTVAAAALGGGALALALAPVAWPFFVTRQELGFERGLDEVRERSADVLTYLELRSNWLYSVTPAGHVFESSLFLGGTALVLAGFALGWLRRPAPASPNRGERWLSAGVWLCLGLALLALAIRGRIHVGPVRASLSFSAVGAGLLGLALARHAVAGWHGWRAGAGDRRLTDREWVALLLGLAAFAFLLSLGPVVSVAGHPIGSGLYAWLYPYLLPLRAIRAATRIGVLVVFAGALLAAFGVKWVRERWPRWGSAPVIAVVVGLLLAEYATAPLPYGRVTAATRPVDAELRRDPADVAVLEWPTNVPDTDADAMFRSLGHGKRLVNGYSGFTPGLIPELSRLLTTPGFPFPTAAAQAALRRIYPLRYLVVRLADPALDAVWQPVWSRLRESAPPLLRFRGTFGTDDLYEILPLPERGRRVERWMSYDFLRGRPVLRLTLRPIEADLDGTQWVDVSLNGRVIERVALDRDASVALRLSPPFLSAEPNVVALTYGYARPTTLGDIRYRIGATGVASPGDLRVRGVGQPHGSASSIEFNGTELSPDRRGYNLVALDPAGRLVKAAAFDTFLEAEASAALAAWVDALPLGTIVAGAVRDEGSGQLTPEAVRALSTLGVAGDLRGRFREAHAFVGVKGAPPGTALEALGPEPVALAVGRSQPELGLELREFALERGPSPR